MARTRARRIALAGPGAPQPAAPDSPSAHTHDLNAYAHDGEKAPEETSVQNPEAASVQNREAAPEQTSAAEESPEAGPEEFAEAFQEEMLTADEELEDAGFAREPALEQAPQAPKPARSPPVLMLVIDEEEETEFCTPASPPPLQVIQGRAAPVAAIEPETESESEPPFDPPDLEDLLAVEDDEDDEEPPFDPADLEELTQPSLSIPLATPAPEPAPEPAPAPANENGRGASLGPVRNVVPEGARQAPAPAISIYLSWDRPAAADFFKTVAADPRLARTEITIERGGLDGAAIHCSFNERPDLVVVDSDLRGAALLASLDRLMQAVSRDTKVIVIGAVNDVTLLREMAQRGVDEYLIWPIKPQDVAGAACALFANVCKARVIAVLGARGGIGASTIAHNLAWCIAERQRVRTTLVDLDLPFGTAAFDFKLEPLRSLADVLDAPDQLSDVALEQVSVQRSDRFTIISAPATPWRGRDLDAETAHALISAARRLSTYVVLDLPHTWEPWVKQALLGADEVVLVSSLDIASLRNTDNIAKALKNERQSDPIVVLSMTGVPKRPEVPTKEFAEALAITPAASLAFEPNIFGAASITGQMIGEIAPGSKAAHSLDQLATLLTGRLPMEAPTEATPGRKTPAVDELDADPFESALVNAYALEDHEASLGPFAAPQTGDQPAIELAPLVLLEPALLEPDYMARARAIALEELDAIENSRRHPQQRGSIGRLAAVAAGMIVSLAAFGAYMLTRDRAPGPEAHASVVAAAQTAPAAVAASTPAPASTPEQMAGEYQAALRLIESNTPDQALATMRRLAEAGFVIAQYRLAKMYERAEGVGYDLAQARLWTERAAAGGNRNAMHDLGVYYARGEGAPRDEATARAWFQRAAELGFADSQFNLGVLYEQGRGVEADAGEALYWFRLAANQGDQAAGERAMTIEMGLTPFDLERVDVRIAAFEPRAADPIANGQFAQQQAVEAAPASHAGPAASRALAALPTSLPADSTPR